jgi:SNF2 family DNA or RNA helicase/uncharacterized Zn finger protein
MAAGYGTTPWGAWFIEVLGTYGINGRLQRGKTYANTGKVTSLTVQDHQVIAKVKGRSSPYYTVKIEFPPMPQDEQRKVFDIMKKDPLLLSRIQAGELPEELMEALQKQHIKLIPEHWGDMKRSCTCPDWGDPCKHMAAVYYVLARQIDADPHLLFQLRGIDIAAHFGESMTRELEPPFRVEAATTAQLPRTLPAEAPSPFPDGNYIGYIQSLLPKKPVFSDRDFTVPLLGFYHQAVRSPLEGIDVDESLEHAFAHADWSLKVSALEPGCTAKFHYRLPSGREEELGLSGTASLFLSFARDQGTAEYRFLYYFFRLMRSLWKSSAFGPVPWVTAGVLKIYWKPLDTLPAIRDALNQIASYEPGLLRSKGKAPKVIQGRSTVDLLASTLLTELVQEVGYTLSGGSEDYRLLLEVFFKGRGIKIDKPAYRNLPLAIDAWLSVLRTDFTAWQYRCTLKAARSGTRDTTDIPTAYRLSFDVLLSDGAVPLKDALERTGRRDVLRAPTALSAYLPELRSLIKTKSVLLSEERLTTFLEEAGALLSRLGIQVVVPKELHRELKPRLVLRDTKGAATSLVSYLDLANLVSYEWTVALGDRLLSVDEFETLVAQKTTLIRFKDGFVRLDVDEIAELLKRAKSKKQISAVDVIKARFSNEAHLSPELHRAIDTLFQEKEYLPPVGLQASLRPYQLRGYNWACSLLMAGFGCIIADDMGLGKTIQAIAVLLRLEEAGLLGEGGALVVAPAALLSNWERELERFAPTLTVERYHGYGRSLAQNKRVLLTTYQTAVRDAAKLAGRHFSLLIADEAHIMKNAATAASRTIKSLEVPYRLALSGTPVENRLEDLRSLFDFIIPGYLGSPDTFKREYRKPIEVDRDEERAEKLRAITAPFLLRRLKTDKAIISDLPDKIIINEYASLETEQAALYESVVRDVLARSEKTTEPAERSALILKLLTSLKQICDHPRCYDKESPPLSDLSGKAQLLIALLEEILRGDEKVLVFSQYVETLEILKTIIQEELEEPVLLYHGGLGPKKRDQVVQEFQTNPLSRIMLISLKAGGLGLNLTAANRVIHYDLWFNPAVENQATDRAFRIGQKSNVFVHRFITQNTFEEKIDAMLTAKRELADMTVASGESWLTRMSHEELKALFSS